VVHVLDDVGFADLGFSGQAAYRTPTLDALATTAGVRLSRYYVQPVCTPTRAALMTARFPFRSGLQEAMPQASEAALPTAAAGARTLAEELASAAHAPPYRTIMLGKWHLGYARWADTPTGRGFARHVGYFQGEEDYYNHTFCSQTCVLNGSAPTPLLGRCGLDLWDGREPLRGAAGNYSTHVYRDAAVRVIEEHATAAPAPAPLFLYAAWQAAHVPLQAPPPGGPADALCAHVADARRRVYCAMVVELDAAIGAVHAALERAGMMERALVLVTTDNGGMPSFAGGGGLFCDSVGSNHPLRAGKATLFEGGVRGVALLAGGALPAGARGAVYGGLAHAVDVPATLLEAAGVIVPPPTPPTLSLRRAYASYGDGVSFWCALPGAACGGDSGNASAAAPPRAEVPINIASNGSANSAIIVGDMKLILAPHLRYDGYFPPPPARHVPAPPRPAGAKAKCDCYLFNVSADPTESNDLAMTPGADATIAALRARLASYVASGDYSNGQDYSAHIGALPALHGGTWAPWLG
jgi:arylsulfatase A-like enzyme